MSGSKVATERLFWNEDKTKLVSEDSPEARILAAAVGDEIPEVEKPAKAVKAADTFVPEPEPAVVKQAEKSADKAVKAADNK